MMLVDHHCHLDFPEFANDLDGVVARASGADVRTLVSISTRIREVHRYRTIAEAYRDVFFSVGTHPHNAHEELDVSLSELIELLDHPKCVAVGEAGLDYHYDNSPIEAQEQGFRFHIQAARETGLPLEIHAREADEHTARVLEEEYEKGPFPAVLHCFTAGPDLAKRALALGLYISFSGIVTFKNAQSLRDIAAKVPLSKLLVETDAPYLAPVPYRGKTNEPSFVSHTADVVAKARGISKEELARATSENFFRFYSKARPPEGFEHLCPGHKKNGNGA